jgi:UDP-N-acetylglucosamine--N-acetylmuramyl-(pentapeptide) pyrophosphoryl-undecaprenol N-acetylglucosamine transferase
VSVFAVIAGGGSGGHVLPGVAIAEALVARGHARDEIVFMGSRLGMEASLVPPTGLPTRLYNLTSFPRRLTWKVPFKWLRAGANLTVALVAAWREFARLRPQAVVSVGGYASLPGVVAARLRKVPIVVVSYDAHAGASSRFAARFAVACAVGFEHLDLPRKELTGAPVRPEILAIDVDRDRAAARVALGIPADRFTVLVVGGSQGSGALNAAFDDWRSRHRNDSNLALRHVLGARFVADRTDDLRTDGLWYQAVGFEGSMPQAYAAADVVVARSGATTVAELAVLGVPSILVPWPDSAGDHQTANARFLADPGGAVLIPEREFTTDRLDAELDRLRDPQVRRAIAQTARSLGRRDAADRIAALVERSARD